MNYQNRKVVIIGMARSGVAAARLLVKHGAQVVVNDSRTEEAIGAALAPLNGLPVERCFGAPAADMLAKNPDDLVISPGIPDTAPFVVEAKKRGIRVIGELELASELTPGLMVSVTGTNGKTTTVSLLGEIFRTWGRKTWVVGNIGEPYSLAGLDADENTVSVVEVSSFQMETVETFHPKAAALLNITEDHLNRHGTMEVYTEMKMRMFAQQTAEDFAVFNADDPALAPLPAQVKSRVLFFSRKSEPENGTFVRGGRMIFRLDGVETDIMDVKDIYIPGPHNLENALAAACIAACQGMPGEVIAEACRTFQGVEHRIEFVRELEGVRYINDSKGTNVDSTIKAVQTMDRPTAIILGGYDKHCDFTPMVKEMLASPYIRHAVLIGVTAKQIADTLDREGFTSWENAATLEEAVDLCRAKAEAGWNVILSPACASFDMFSDYEARGRIFKDIVRALN